MKISHILGCLIISSALILCGTELFSWDLDNFRGAYGQKIYGKRDFLSVKAAPKESVNAIYIFPDEESPNGYGVYDNPTVCRNFRNIKSSGNKGPKDIDLDSDALKELGLEVFLLVNDQRRRAFLPLLEWDDELGEMARVRAEELTSLFAHVRPDGRAAGTVFKEYDHISRRTGENIAMGYRLYPVETVALLMRSQGHKLNMLNISYTKMGVGVAKKGKKLYYTQLFSSGPLEGYWR
jgi:uncharacterized protein YkwD